MTTTTPTTPKSKLGKLFEDSKRIKESDLVAKAIENMLVAAAMTRLRKMMEKQRSKHIGSRSL